MATCAVIASTTGVKVCWESCETPSIELLVTELETQMNRSAQSSLLRPRNRFQLTA